jgi:hypothetical protein
MNPRLRSFFPRLGVQRGPSEYDTSVRNTEVVYVSGNGLVIKLEDGRVEHMVVPDSDKFHIDGRELSVFDLKRERN